MKDLFSLSGRVALVTGGSRGIGAMIVQGFLEHGCSRVYITARKAAQCDAAARELSQFGECSEIIPHYIEARLGEFGVKTCRAAGMSFEHEAGDRSGIC